MRIPSNQFKQTPVINLEAPHLCGRIGSAPSSPLSSRRKGHTLGRALFETDSDSRRGPFEPQIDLQQSQLTSSLTTFSNNDAMDEYDQNVPAFNRRDGGRSSFYITASSGLSSLPLADTVSASGNPESTSRMSYFRRYVNIA